MNQTDSPSHSIFRHCPPIRLITIDVGWAVNQTDLLSRAIALLDTAHQTNR
ncbi:MAG: hypothetical protein F6K55_14515 [Moorea sp. SIO4A3]|nr:hypothetical protein [Moorena sp. SIO4A3]